MGTLLREPECLKLLSFGVTVAQVFLVHLVGVRIPEGQQWRVTQVGEGGSLLNC
jgi:hypothetical protein